MTSKKLAVRKGKQKVECHLSATGGGRMKGAAANFYARLYAREIAHELNRDEMHENSDIEAMLFSERIMCRLLPPHHSAQYSSMSRSFRREWRVFSPRWIQESPRSESVFDSIVNAKALADFLANSSIFEMHRRELSTANDITQVGHFARRWTDGMCPTHVLNSTFGGEALINLSRCRAKECRCKHYPG